jgi:ATP/maltotriose-dependent transcriptional regulator MalT
LPDDQKTLLRRLSVFAGGWNLEAADYLCAGGDFERQEVLDLMSRLVDQSLVVAKTQFQEARYWLLETVKEYAQTKLVEAGEQEAIKNTHLQYFAEVAEKAEPHLQRAEVVKWSQIVETDNDNMRAALHWSLTSGDAYIGLKLAGAMAFFWRTSGHVNEGTRWYDDLLSKTCDGVYFARAKALFGAGWLAWWRGDNRLATQFTKSALCKFRDLGEKWWIARSMQEIAFHCFARGEYEQTASLADEALSLSHDLGDKYVTGYSLVLKAILAEHCGDDVSAAQMYRECLTARRSVGHVFGMANALRGLGRVALRQQDYDGAGESFRESLSLALQQRDVSNAAPSIEGMASLAIARNEYERAARLLGGAEALRKAIGVPPLAWELESYEKSLRAVSEQLRQRDFSLLRKMGHAMSFEEVVSYCLDNVPSSTRAPDSAGRTGGSSA